MYSISQKQGTTVVLQTPDLRATNMSNFSCLNPPPIPHKHTHTQNFTCKFSGWAAGWNLEFNSREGQEMFLFFKNVRTVSGAHPASCSVVVGCEVGRSPPSSAGIKMSGAVPLQPLYAFILWTGTALCVPLRLFQFPHSAVVNVTSVSCL